ncbi:hypothetical protein FO519_008886 [Halicephalobus sp. NKZ332]|nr:hypothetical protein FO519_008886 [Halicephalobus sp. NKZ332]
MSEEKNGGTSMKIKTVEKSGDQPRSQESQGPDNLSSLAAFSTEFLARSSQDSRSSPMEDRSAKSDPGQVTGRTSRPPRAPHPLTTLPFRPGFPIFGLNYQNAMLNTLIAQQQWSCFGPRPGNPLSQAISRVEDQVEVSNRKRKSIEPIESASTSSPSNGASLQTVPQVMFSNHGLIQNTGERTDPGTLQLLYQFLQQNPQLANLQTPPGVAVAMGLQTMASSSTAASPHRRDPGTRGRRSRFSNHTHRRLTQENDEDEDHEGTPEDNELSAAHVSAEFTEDETLNCEWDGCSRTLQGLKNLVEHVVSQHIQTQSIYCCRWANCTRGRPFPAQYMLLLHVRRHTGERPHKPYVCIAVNCNKSYTDPSSLRKHIKTQHGDKAYDLCKASKAQGARDGKTYRLYIPPKNANEDMRLVTDEQLREMGVVDGARLPKPIPLPADKANIENIGRPESNQRETESGRETKSPTSTSTTDSAAASTGAFSPVGRSAFNHPNGAVSRGASDDIDPNMPVDVENCTPRHSPLWYSGNVGNSGRDENGTISRVSVSSTSSSPASTVIQSGSSSTTSTTASGGSRSRISFSVEQNMLALSPSMSGAPVIGSSTSKNIAVVTPQRRPNIPNSVDPVKLIQGEQIFEDIDDESSVIRISRFVPHQDWNEMNYSSLSSQTSSPVVLLDSDETINYFENEISTENIPEDLRNTPLVLCQGGKFLIPVPGLYEIHKEVVKKLLNSEIKKGGVSLFTFGKLCSLTKEAKRRNINSPLKTIIDLVPDNSPETLSRVLENLEDICLLLQDMSMVDKPK